MVKLLTLKANMRTPRGLLNRWLGVSLGTQRKSKWRILTKASVVLEEEPLLKMELSRDPPHATSYPFEDDELLPVTVRNSRSMRREKPNSSSRRNARLSSRGSTNPSNRDKKPDARADLGDSSHETGKESRNLSYETQLQCCLILQDLHELSRQVRRTKSKELLARYNATQNAAAEAKRLLLEAYYGYIVYQAQLLQRGLPIGAKASFDDMILAGVQGLMLAAQRFRMQEIESGGYVRFLGYAHNYIRKNLIATLGENSFNHVFAPRYIHDIKPRVMRVAEQLREEANQGIGPGEEAAPVRVKDIAARAGVSTKAVRDVLHFASLQYLGSGTGRDEEEGQGSADMANKPGARRMLKGGEGGQEERGLAVPSKAEELVDQQLQGSRLKALLASILNKQEIGVLEVMIGFGSQAEEREGVSTYKAAEVLGISRQRVSQVYGSALKKLKLACAKDAQLAQQLAELCSIGS